MGAAFVFMFAIIGQWLEKIFERKNKSFMTLRKIEYFLNINLNVLEANKTIVKGAIESFENKKFHVLKLGKFEITNEYAFDLLNLDFIQ